MAFVALYDASVLYGQLTRDLLIRLGRTRLFRARWSEMILDEVFRAIMRQRPDLDLERLQRTRALMTLAIPDVTVTHFEHLIPVLELPDPDDRHVLACAIRAGAQVIVTENLKDFPSDILSPYGMEAQSADLFVSYLVELDAAVVAETLREQAASYVRSPMSLDELLDTLHTHGFHQTVNAVRALPDLDT